jgi:hypothetical protein
MTYRNPPKKYQFKKGQSGNPKGRPRKKLRTGTTLADDLRRELSEEITVKKNGETKRVTKQSALISSIATSAINGSSSQQRLVLQMLFMHGMNNDNAIDAKELQKHDEALLVELQKLGLKIDRPMMTHSINRETLDALLRRSPSLFFTHLFPKIDTVRDFECPWYLHAISQYLLEMYNGTCPRLILNAPPRSLKTSLANTYFIPWLLGKDPSTKVMVVTYGDDLSSTLAKATKKVFLHPAYQKIFPHTVLENDNMQATRLRTSKSGHVIFTSLHGVMTGLGADWIILDDPIQAAHMRSEARLNDVIQVFKQSVSTRLNNPKNGKILLIQQRISPNDLCGALTDMPMHPWKVLCLPARFDEPAQFDLGLFGKKDVVTGELLTPTRMSEASLERKKLRWAMQPFMPSICKSLFMRATAQLILIKLSTSVGKTLKKLIMYPQFIKAGIRRSRTNHLPTILQ